MMNKSLRGRNPESSAKPRYGFQHHAAIAESRLTPAKKEPPFLAAFESL
jgi:hypothetical protein